MKFWNLKHNKIPPEPIPKIIPKVEQKPLEVTKTTKEFKLKVGMKFPEIYEELHNQVSGETSQEIQEFYKDDTEYEAKQRMAEINKMFGDNRVSYNSHEVVLSDDKYGIIKKNGVYLSSNSVKKSSPVYYISGINDEDMYFVHPVMNWNGEIDLKSILDYINRVDEGFTERLQGDILIQFKPYKEGSNKVVFGKSTSRFSGMDHVVSANPRPENRTAEPINELTIELGRHTLLVKNRAERYQTDEGLFVVVESDVIEIMHPEHKKTVKPIPEGHFAILANQRGRRDTTRFD